MKEIVYKGRDNPNTITIFEDGEPMNFTPVTRMVCEFKGSAVKADTNDDSALIDWSQGGGVVEFNINDLSVESGARVAKLIAYDPDHPNGQNLLHEESFRLVFKFVD